MPVTLQLAGLKYKNSQGQFQSADCLKGDDGSAFVVHATADSGGNITLNKTWQEINTASRETPVILTEESGNSVIFYCNELYVESHTYYATFKSANTLLIFSVNDPSGYPALEQDRINFPTIDDEAGEGATDVTFSANKLTSEFDALSNALNQSNAATNSDIGKAHSPKTVVDGKVTEWQYVEVGGGGQTDIGLSVVNGEICVTYEEASA